MPGALAIGRPVKSETSHWAAAKWLVSMYRAIEGGARWPTEVMKARSANLSKTATHTDKPMQY
eukprot:9308464-Alexandrium_andersonii.AAC.1